MKIIYPPLSPGQIRIREIINDLTPIWTSLPKYTKGEIVSDDDRKDYRGLYSRTLDAFASDSTVTEDSVTGQYLINSDFSRSYVNHRYSISEGIDDQYEGEIKVRWDRLEYSNPPSRTHKAFSCGVKSGSTISILFSIATQEFYGANQLSDCTYYVNDGVLETGSNGTHRVLACLLWGAEFDTLDKLSFRHTTYFRTGPIDPIFNKALLKFQAIAEEHNCSFHFGGNYDHFYDAKDLYNKMSYEQWQDLSQYLEFINTRTGSKDFYLYQVPEILAQIKQLKDMDWLSRKLLQLRHNYWDPYVATPLQIWYLGLSDPYGTRRS